MRVLFPFLYCVFMVGCASLLSLTDFELEAEGYDIQVTSEKERTLQTLEKELQECRSEKKGFFGLF